MTAGGLAIAVLISGRGFNMAAIAAACRDGRVGGRVVRVISDRDTAPGLELARSLGLQAMAVPASSFASRADFEHALQARLLESGCELVALAGFMRILGRGFVASWQGRMLNIHPSLLPRHKGLHTHRRVLAAGEREHGASVHYVTPELDGGPVVLQGKVPVLADDDEARLSARVHACEYIIYPRVLGWIAAGRLRWMQGAPWLDGEPLTTPRVEEFPERDMARA